MRKKVGDRDGGDSFGKPSTSSVCFFDFLQTSMLGWVLNGTASRSYPRFRDDGVPTFFCFGGGIGVGVKLGNHP